MIGLASPVLSLDLFFFFFFFFKSYSSVKKLNENNKILGVELINGIDIKMGSVNE